LTSIGHLTLDTDGTLSRPQVLRFHDDGRLVVAARSVERSSPGDDLFTLGPDFTLVSGADAFGDDDAITTDLDITADGRFALVGDNGLFSTHRVAVFRLDGASPAPAQVISPIPDPMHVVASPFGDTAIVASGDGGDAIFVLDYAADAFSLRGESGPGPAPGHRRHDPQGRPFGPGFGRRKPRDASRALRGERRRHRPWGVFGRFGHPSERRDPRCNPVTGKPPLPDKGFGDNKRALAPDDRRGGMHDE